MDISNPIDSHSPELSAARLAAKKLCHMMNALPAQQMKARRAIYRELFASVSSAYIEPHFFCDYGSNIHLGERFYANHNCVILDAAPVHIGARVMLGPMVQILATNHPLEARARASGVEYAAGITIGDDVWIGAGAIILPGVSLGQGCVIGAGAVVTADIPAFTLAVGNPAQVIKSINPD